MVVGIPDVITCANFGEDRLRGLWVAGVQSFPFSIDFDRHPDHTLALPCECVMVALCNRADHYIFILFPSFFFFFFFLA